MRAVDFRMILGLYRLFWQKNFRPRLVPNSYPFPLNNRAYLFITTLLHNCKCYMPYYVVLLPICNIINKYEWNDIMKRNQIQGFGVYIQANSNPFPNDFRTPSGNEVVSFISFYLIVYLYSFHLCSFHSFILFDRFIRIFSNFSFHSSLCQNFEQFYKFLCPENILKF
jgi:hypothetical protein